MRLLDFLLDPATRVKSEKANSPHTGIIEE